MNKLRAITIIAAVLVGMAVALSCALAITEYNKRKQWEQFIETVKVDCEHAPATVKTPEGEFIILKYVKP